MTWRQNLIIWQSLWLTGTIRQHFDVGRGFEKGQLLFGKAQSVVTLPPARLSKVMGEQTPAVCRVLFGYASQPWT